MTVTTKGDKDKRPFFAMNQIGVFEKEVNESSGLLEVFYNQLPFGFGNTFYIPGPGGSDSDDPETNVYLFSYAFPEFKNGVWRFFGGEKNGLDILTNDSAELHALDHIYCIVAKNNIAPLIPMTKAEYYANWIKKRQATIRDLNAKIKEVNDNKDPNLDAEF